jgi:DNA replication licensing factor MCM2
MTDGEEEEEVVDDEEEAQRLGQAYEEDEDVEGEDLFGEGMEGDYTGNAALDQYDQALGLNDEEDLEAMDETTRRIAELRMQRRDMAEGKGSFGQRSRAPAFLQMDEEEDDFEDDLMRRRRRRHYDELVQAEEEEEEIPLDQLAQARTDSLESWIALEPVRKSIIREFRNFLVTCVDAAGNSVYGPKATLVGERECMPRVARYRLLA